MLVRLLVVLAAVEVALPVLVYLVRHRLMFFPAARPEAVDGLPSFREGVDARLVEVRRPDGRGLATYDAAPAGAPRDRGPVVLFLHGNAGNIAWRAPLLDAFVRGTGARTLMVDYSGYGGNPGTPTEEVVVADGIAAFDHLIASGVPGERIVLYGESIGGAVALGVAERRRPAGVVLQSCFSSTSSMALRVYPWMPLAALLARGSFPNADRVRDLQVPVLVVHGDRDGIVPPAEGKRLHAAAPPGTEHHRIEGAGHNDLFDAGGRAYLEMLGERFRKWAGR